MRLSDFAVENRTLVTKRVILLVIQDVQVMQATNQTLYGSLRLEFEKVGSSFFI